MADSPNPMIKEAQKAQLLNHWRLSGKQQAREKLISSGFNLSQVENILRVIEANQQILVNHQPQRYLGRVVYLSASENNEKFKEAVHLFDPMQSNGWNSWVEGGIEVIEVLGNHNTYYTEPHVRVFAEKLNACLEEVDGVLLSERR